MTVFQLLMLGASAFFAFKIYEHIQTLKDSKNESSEPSGNANKTAHTFSPFSPEALMIKADAAFEEKNFTKALALLNEANAKEANNPEVLFKTAYILQMSGDDEEAMKYYKQALELDKENEYIHNSMASLYRKKGEFASAKMHLHASLQLDDRNPATYYNFGNLLVDMKHDEEAMLMYEKALQIKPDFAEAQEELAKLK